PSSRSFFGAVPILMNSEMWRQGLIRTVIGSKSSEIVLASSVVLKADIPRRNHAVESAPQPALKDGSGVRDQQDQGKKIGEHPWYDKKNSTGKDQYPVNHLFRRDDTLRKTLLDLLQCPEAFETGKHQAQQGRKNDQSYGLKRA